MPEGDNRLHKQCRNDKKTEREQEWHRQQDTERMYQFKWFVDIQKSFRNILFGKIERDDIVDKKQEIRDSYTN